MNQTEYEQFLSSKRHLAGSFGFEPTFMPDMLFPFQKELVAIGVRKGRFAEFADCGLGKTFIQLTWAQNIVEKTNRPVLILTPLAVGAQTVVEAAKLGDQCTLVLDFTGERLSANAQWSNPTKENRFEEIEEECIKWREVAFTQFMEGKSMREQIEIIGKLAK